MNGQFKKVLPVLLGNTLEAYDFCLYGLLVLYFSKVFFPQSEFSVTLAFLLFSVAYLARPIGSVVWGHIADKYGRKPVMISTLTLMIIPAIGMAIVPSYDSIGTAASVIVISLRFLQGLAFGGEFPTILVTLYELAPSNKKGIYGSFAPSFFILGYLIAMMFILILTNLLSEYQMLNWGWRIPLVVSVVFIFVISYIRFNLIETIPNKVKSKSPVIEAFRYNSRSIIKISLYMLCEACLFYNVMFYNHTVLKTREIFTDAQVFMLQITCGLIIVILLPIIGYFSDIFGRQKLSKYTCISLIICSIFLYRIILGNNIFMIITGFIVFAILLAFVLAVFPAIITDAANKNCRVSIVGIGYTIITLIGSFTPILNQQLIYFTHSIYSPSLYIIICSFITLITLYSLKDRQKYNGEKNVS